MRELTCQITHHKLLPYSAEDEAELSNFIENQTVRVKVYATKKQRSLQQLRLYWACCTKVADNTDDFMWNDKAKTDFQCRVALHFVDPKVTVVRPDGAVQFKYRSISFANLRHIEACHYFSRSFDIMSAKLGITPEELVRNAEG